MFPRFFFFSNLFISQVALSLSLLLLKSMEDAPHPIPEKEVLAPILEQNLEVLQIAHEAKEYEELNKSARALAKKRRFIEEQEADLANQMFKRRRGENQDEKEVKAAEDDAHEVFRVLVHRALKALAPGDTVFQLQNHGKPDQDKNVFHVCFALKKVLDVTRVTDSEITYRWESTGVPEQDKSRYVTRICFSENDYSEARLHGLNYSVLPTSLPGIEGLPAVKDVYRKYFRQDMLCYV